MDVSFVYIVDAECFTKKVNEQQGKKTTVIQEHVASAFSYIIIQSDGVRNKLVYIRGENPACNFIQKMEKVVERLQDYLARGSVIHKLANEIIDLAGFLTKEKQETILNKAKKFQS